MSRLVQLHAPAAPLPAELRPELLAPAGDWDCVRAAIENGADAVYFGLDSGLNARVRATNFSVDDLPSLMALLHRRGLKGYLTLNTLVFTRELPAAETIVRRAAEAGVDAVLVQDLGLVRLIRAVTPDLPIHASTQMTLTSAECIQFSRELGVERVVLARELSVREIGKIHGQTDAPLEAFVHGALCVAYSGQCLTSESLGGRSANRGHCAQACRLPYDLICDGRDVATDDVKYLLSPQDLAAYELIPELIRAGVCSLKIEGRLKTPEYVANITRHYREAIDSAMAGRPVEFSRRQIEEMELSFSRGFSPGWLEGCDHKRLVPGKSSSKRGVLLGEVVSVRRGRVGVRLVGSVKRGDGVVFDCGRPVDDEQGGRVYEVFRGRDSIEGEVRDGVVELTFAYGAIDFDEIGVGQQVWKNDDPELTSRLRASYTVRDPVRRVPLNVSREILQQSRDMES
ncbi:MAG TPA: U32 family peptidase, partial [Pirellulaceae bacterium]|nr:U32 family peptidase [Pirellulaceae bacterium]